MRTLLAIILSLGVAASVGSAQPARISIGDASLPESELVSLRYVGPAVSNPSSVRFVLVNRSDLTIRYDGYSPQFPLYGLEVRKRRDWSSANFGLWCGTGLGTRRLEPGSFVEFTLDLGGYERQMVRVWITVRPGDEQTQRWAICSPPVRLGRIGLSN